MMYAGDSFRVGVSRDLLGVVHALGADTSLREFHGAPNVEFLFIERADSEILPSEIAELDALLLLSPKITRASLAGVGRLAVIARFGVGLDNVDLDACSSRGIVVTITPGGVRRPTALGAIALLLALSHRLTLKERAARETGWPRRFDSVGIGITGRVLGLVGFGNIGREIAKLVAPFDMTILAHTPHLTRAAAASAGARSASLEEVLVQSDFLIVVCPLTAESYHLIDARRLALMKPTAHLINVSRGAIVDEHALVAALRQRLLAGAALDVFESEPLDDAEQFVGLDNVILTPHAVAYTDQLYRDCLRDAIGSILTMRSGCLPSDIANPEVLAHHALKAKLDRFRATYGKAP